LYSFGAAVTGDNSHVAKDGFFAINVMTAHKANGLLSASHEFRDTTRNGRIM